MFRTRFILVMSNLQETERSAHEQRSGNYISIDLSFISVPGMNMLLHHLNIEKAELQCLTLPAKI